MSTIFLENVQLVCPLQERNHTATLELKEGRIAAIHSLPKPCADAQRYDCSGLVAFPGLFDILTYCGDSDSPHREDFTTLSKAASAGGYTDIALGPWGEPCVDNASMVHEFMSRARRTALNVHVIGALTADLQGTDLAELGQMAEAGVAGFSNGGAPIESSVVLQRALQYARPFGLPLFLRPSVADLESLGVMQEGQVSARIGMRGIPDASEAIGVERIRQLSAGNKVCLTHLSTKDCLHRIETIKSKMSVAVTARQFLLDTSLLESFEYDTRLRLAPPVRDVRSELADAFKAGKIDIVFADHHPLSRVEKEHTFEDAVPGAMGLETALSAVFTAVGMSFIEQIVESMSVRPASLFGVVKSLQIDHQVDMVLFDPKAEWFPQKPFFSKGINEPLSLFCKLNGPLKGRVVGTRRNDEWTYLAETLKQRLVNVEQ